MPIGAIIAAASVASGIAGVASQSKEQGLQQTGLNDQNQIASQEATDKQQIFNQLSSFYSPYLQSGSPYLQNIQSAASGQNAQQFNNAAGQFREQAQAQGTGYGPSGTTASGLSQLGAGAAQSGASNYLANLLNNEQVKFQAASGLNAAGTMAGSPQNQPSVSTQLPAANTASSIGGLGQIFSALSQNGTIGNSGSSGTTLPSGTTAAGLDNILFPSSTPSTGSSGTPTTQGWTY
jgi:hypothetical protein